MCLCFASVRSVQHGGLGCILVLSAAWRSRICNKYHVPYQLHQLLQLPAKHAATTCFAPATVAFERSTTALLPVKFAEGQHRPAAFTVCNYALEKLQWLIAFAKSFKILQTGRMVCHAVDFRITHRRRGVVVFGIVLNVQATHGTHTSPMSNATHTRDRIPQGIGMEDGPPLECASDVDVIDTPELVLRPFHGQGFSERPIESHVTRRFAPDCITPIPISNCVLIPSN